MKRIYEELFELEPTYEEIESFVDWLRHATYGILTFTKKDDNPLSIRLHDTRGIKRGGRLHIDIVSGEYHLMLDRYDAPMFLEFLKEKREAG